jgi:hypothetical protein
VNGAVPPASSVAVKTTCVPEGTGLGGLIVQSPHPGSWPVDGQAAAWAKIQPLF